MRDGAAAWCESALTGTVVPGPERGSEPSGCGDRLAVNGDTVRLALDRIFEEEATYTYRHDEVSERCAAAAKLAAP
ncbi:hypothetical protein KKHFBJBL_00187 [Brevundimonas sp. NIBR11]|nr:hypothetical protein KKHFBJBL_00187 [Brevundimonas sp. NIBR11]